MQAINKTTLITNILNLDDSKYNNTKNLLTMYFVENKTNPVDAFAMLLMFVAEVCEINQEHGNKQGWQLFKSYFEIYNDYMEKTQNENH